MADIKPKPKWLKYMARAGFAARGVVYTIVGLFALVGAFNGGQTPGSRGALVKLLSQPGGTVLLAAVGVGLLGYAMWRALQAILDVDWRGNDAKALAVRGGQLISCIIHLLLALTAASLLLGWGPQSGYASEEGKTQSQTAWLMAKPFGRWLVGGIGVGVIVAGLAQFVKGYKEKFEEELQADRGKLRWISPIGKFGLYARAVVLCLIGTFLIVAAWQAQAHEARGLGGSLETLRRQPYGPWLMGVVALGLFAFGVYSFILAYYRRINIEPPPRILQAAGR